MGLSLYARVRLFLWIFSFITTIISVVISVLVLAEELENLDLFDTAIVFNFVSIAVDIITLIALSCIATPNKYSLIYTPGYIFTIAILAAYVYVIATDYPSITHRLSNILFPLSSSVVIFFISMFMFIFSDLESQKKKQYENID